MLQIRVTFSLKFYEKRRVLSRADETYSISRHSSFQRYSVPFTGARMPNLYCTDLSLSLCPTLVPSHNWSQPMSNPEHWYLQASTVPPPTSALTQDTGSVSVPSETATAVVRPGPEFQSAIQSPTSAPAVSTSSSLLQASCSVEHMQLSLLVLQKPRISAQASLANLISPYLRLSALCIPDTRWRLHLWEYPFQQHLSIAPSHQLLSRRGGAQLQQRAFLVRSAARQRCAARFRPAANTSDWIAFGVFLP